MKPLFFRRRGRSWPGFVLLVLMLVARAATAAAPAVDPWAPFDTPWFDKIGVDEGLPHSITTAVTQDGRGLIWIGTMGGLVRYDGYRMQVFEAASTQAPGPPDAYIRSLLALPDGSVLIGTNAGGLARFDPATNAFKPYSIGKDSLAERKIYDLADDHAGGAWIATDAGLQHLDMRSGRIESVPTGPGTAVRDFSSLQDRAGNLWLGNNNGLFERRKGSQSFERITTDDAGAATVLGNQIWALYEDNEGRLWVGSGQAGAAYRDVDGHWHGVPGFNGHPGGVQQATVRDFLEASADRMWIATDGNGLIEYRPGAEHGRVIEHDPARPSSLPGNSVRALAQDRSGNIWVATDLGIARNDPNARTAFSVLPSPLEPDTLSETNVHGVFVDSRQRIWLGLGAGHIDVIDLKAATMRHLHLGQSQSHRDVQAFSEASDGSIWVGTEGLARVDPDTLAIQDSILPELSDKPVLSLQRDGDNMLIGTYEGVFRYDTRSKSLEHFSNVPGDAASLASDTVRQIARVGDAWWIGTTHGISISPSLDSNSGFENLQHDPGNPASLPQDYVGSITGDADGRVLVSTYGGLGVIEHPRQRPYRFKTVGLLQGLASDKVNSTLADERGHFWASLSNDIARIDSRTLEVQNLGTRDGLHILSYIHTAAARAPGGELMFGGLGGLTVIRPDWRPPPMEDAPLAITQASLNGVPMPFGKLPRDGEVIKVDPPHRNLRVDFSLLDYKAPMETSYSYRMDGLDESWTEISKGSLPSSIYTNLPHGEYRLQLRALTRGMHQRTVATSVIVVVNPRWYETVSARLIAVLLLLATVLALVHLRTLYLRRQAKHLQARIEDQTRDLRSANQRLDELAGTDGLTGAYNRRRFLELAGGERELAEGNPICIALFDLDRFKQINDTYGHLAGDLVIRTAIDVIKRHCRQGDLVGRYGGEEFVLCLPGALLAQALETGERIRDALASTHVSHEGQHISVTVSIGIAALHPGESIEQWLSRADQALYEAKRNGRNRCVAAP